MQVYENLSQGSQEWHSMRRGKVTGTKLESVMGTNLARVQLISELIAEYASEQTKEFKVTAEMERGTEQEPVAVEAFEKKTGFKVNRDIAFMVSDEFDWLGFSPDGVINDGEEMIEIKNPDTKTLMFYKIANIIPKEETGIPASKQTWCGVPLDYKYQVLCGFTVNEKCKRIHFVVYDDRILDPEQKLYTVIVERKTKEVKEELAKIKEELIRFRADWLKWQEAIIPSKF